MCWRPRREKIITVYYYFQKLTMVPNYVAGFCLKRFHLINIEQIILKLHTFERVTCSIFMCEPNESNIGPTNRKGNAHARM